MKNGVKILWVKPHLISLSTGRSIYSYEGRMSMAPNMVLGLHSGIVQPSLEPTFVEFTPAERQALSDYHVALWKRWGRK